jgi:DNA modification methylase
LNINTIYQGNSLDILKMLPDKFVNCCITSPPYYGLRDYGIGGQIGLEKTPDEYIVKLAQVFREVRRVLKDDGTLWVNIGDSYAGSGKGAASHPENVSNHKQGTNRGMIGKSAVTKVSWGECKPKDLIGIPWMLAFALRADGWFLRQDIIWSKPSPMPESVKDRFCKSYEHIFLLSKKPKYYFDHKYALEPATGYDGRKDTFYKGSSKYAGKLAPYVPRNRERWPQRGYKTKDGATGLTEQHHGDDIPTKPLRTKRDVWVIPSELSEISHFAMFPQKLILPCILCGCPENGIVLDPFMGGGTTAVIKKKNLRKYIGCEINPEYIKIAEKRIASEKGLFCDIQRSEAK